MDFLRDHTHLAGGDTREERKKPNLANHVIPRTARLPPTTTPPNPPNHAKPSKSARRQDPPPHQTLKINQISLNPLNHFQPKYP